MKFILDNIIPIAVVLAIAWAICVFQIVLKKQTEKESDASVRRKKRKWAVALSVLSLILHFALCAYLLIIGGEAAQILPILLLSLIGALL